MTLHSGQAGMILSAKKTKGDTHGPDVAGFAGEGGVGTAGGTTGAAAAGGAGGAADGAAASGGGISTCFQSCPSSTMRAMRVPRRTLRLPSSICKEGERYAHIVREEQELRLLEYKRTSLV